MKEKNHGEFAAAAKNAKRRRLDAARRQAKAKELKDAAEKRYRAALAFVKKENEKPRLTKSVREGI